MFYVRIQIYFKKCTNVISVLPICTCSAVLSFCRLMWNPMDFGNLTVIRIPPTLVWQPDIMLYNRNNYGDKMFPDLEIGSSNALVYSNGEVLFVPDRKIEARC